MAASLQSIHWVGIGLSMSLLLMLPIIFYGNIKLFKQRSEPFADKRSMWTVFGLNVTSCIAMIVGIGCPVAISLDLRYLYLILVELFTICFVLVLYFLIVRSWMLYYDYNYSYYASKTGWKEVIDPTIKLAPNWYIRHKSTYGNISYVAKVAFIVYVVIAVLLSVCTMIRVLSDLDMHELPPTTLSIASLIIWISVPALSVLVYAVIVCKTPYFQDIYYIHWELRMHAKLTALFVALIPVVALIRYLSSFYIASLTFFQVCHCYFFAVIVISTFGVMAKNQKSTSKGKPDSELKDALNVEITVPVLLKDRYLFQAFMEHLFSEYSMECLLSFVEFTQFQHFILSRSQQVEAGGLRCDVTELRLLTLHSDVPPSHILRSAAGSAPPSPQSNHMPHQSLSLITGWFRPRSTLTKKSKLKCATHSSAAGASYSKSDEEVSLNEKDERESKCISDTEEDTEERRWNEMNKLIEGCIDDNEIDIIEDKIDRILTGKPHRKHRRKHRQHHSHARDDDDVHAVVYTHCATNSTPISEHSDHEATTAEQHGHHGFHNEVDLALVSQVKVAAHELWLKYMKPGCALEINISGALRDSIQDMLGNKASLMSDENKASISDLLVVFNQTREEMLTLLEYSHCRFQQTEAYAKVEMTMTAKK